MNAALRRSMPHGDHDRLCAVRSRSLPAARIRMTSHLWTPNFPNPLSTLTQAVIAARQQSRIFYAIPLDDSSQYRPRPYEQDDDTLPASEGDEGEAVRGRAEIGRRVRGTVFPGTAEEMALRHRRKAAVRLQKVRGSSASPAASGKRENTSRSD